MIEFTFDVSQATDTPPEIPPIIIPGILRADSNNTAGADAYDGHIDPGAHHCVVPKHLLEFLDMEKTREKIPVTDARGKQTMESLYKLKILLPQEPAVDIYAILMPIDYIILGRSAFAGRTLHIDFSAGQGYLD